MDIQALEQESLKFAASAVDCDKKGLVNEAIFYYKVSCCGHVPVCSFCCCENYFY